MGLSGASDIEVRLRATEDRLAIFQTVSSYTPAVDGLNAGAVGDCYTTDAVYEVGDLGAYRGHAGIVGIVSDPDHGHIARVAEGVGHISSVPYVELGGDCAAATLHMFVVRNKDGGFGIWRLSASRITLARQHDGCWKIAHRINHMLDGAPAGPTLLSRLTEGPAGAWGLSGSD